MKTLGIDIESVVDTKTPIMPTHHGSPYDRGGADSYYRRGVNPHYYGGPQGGPFGGTVKIYMMDMSQEEIDQYMKGYQDNEDAGDFKEW